MQILCPQCHAVYEVGPLIKNAVLVCHRCQTEFGADGEPIASDVNRTPASNSELPLFELAASGRNESSPEQASQPSAATDEERGERDTPNTPEKTAREEPPVASPHKILSISKILEEESDGTQPSAIEEGTEIPEDSSVILHRKKSRIWPWLAMMLLLLGSGGFYFKQDAWLSHPWVRSLLINAHISLPLRNEDWNIVSGSVQAQWISRQDGSRVLLIEGKVENRLYCSMNPPKILIRFFAPGSNDALAEQTHIITDPPTIQQIRQAPYITPAKDKVPVESRGSRTFMLVIENSPKGGAHFELSPIAVVQ